MSLASHDRRPANTSLQPNQAAAAPKLLLQQLQWSSIWVHLSWLPAQWTHTHGTYGTTHKIKSQRTVFDISESKQTSPSISRKTVIKCITNNYCNKAMPHSVKILQLSSSSNSRGLIQKSHGALHHHTCDSGGPTCCLFWYDDEIPVSTGGRK